MALTLAAVTACSVGVEAPPSVSKQEEPLPIVTTTAILADLAKNVGGDLVTVTSIVPAGSDVHSFQSTPGDSVTINMARVIITNGFGLDTFLEPVVLGAKHETSVVVVAAKGLESSLFRLDNNLTEDGDHEGGDHADGDPHFWQNPVFAIHYVERIRDGLSSVDPDHQSEYASNAETYIEQLVKLDLEISKILSHIPTERRHLVTFHDSFRHFGQRYGWRVSSFVGSDAHEVDPATVVRVLAHIDNEELPAVFVESTLRTDVIKQAALDAGLNVWPIYSEIPIGGMITYTEMMRFNANTLAEHLK